MRRLFTPDRRPRCLARRWDGRRCLRVGHVHTGPHLVRGSDGELYAWSDALTPWKVAE